MSDFSISRWRAAAGAGAGARAGAGAGAGAIKWFGLKNHSISIPHDLVYIK